MTRTWAAVVAAVVLLAVSAAAATVSLIPEAVRGTISFGHVGDPTVAGCAFCGPTPVHINAGTPANQGNVNFTVPSAVWPTTPGLTMRVVIEKSLDGGATWSFLMGNNPSDPADHFISAVPTKDGTGLIQFGTRWDGSAMDLRGTMTPGAAFSWGLSATF